jgi:hypothetical protein
MKTITIYLTLPDGSRSRPIHILKDSYGNPHAAPSTADQGTPMTEPEAKRCVEYLIRSIDGCVAIVNDWKQPQLIS